MMTNSATAVQNEQPADSANLILRNDTILGVCEAIGQDFGFSANWLRVPFAAGVLISPLASFGIYFALGLAVLASRLIFPRRVAAAVPQLATEPQQRPISQGAENRTEEELLAA